MAGEFADSGEPGTFIHKIAAGCQCQGAGPGVEKMPKRAEENCGTDVDAASQIIGTPGQLPTVSVVNPSIAAHITQC
jgi:hypothetical protein